MARSPRIKFTVHDLDDNDLPSRSQTSYQDIVRKVMSTGKGQRVQCKTLSDTEAAYAGIKRAVNKFADPNDFDLGMRTSEHYVYVRLA